MKICRLQFKTIVHLQRKFFCRDLKATLQRMPTYLSPQCRQLQQRQIRCHATLHFAHLQVSRHAPELPFLNPQPSAQPPFGMAKFSGQIEPRTQCGRIRLGNLGKQFPSPIAPIRKTISHQITAHLQRSGDGNRRRNAHGKTMMPPTVVQMKLRLG